MPFAQNTKAKQHFVLDVPILHCLEPADEEKLHPGAGTKLLITLGPACHTVETLVEMLEAGVTCARIDLTWGTPEFHRRSLRNLSAAMRQTRRLCSVWLNTSGREMVVRRKVDYDDCGWPTHGESVTATKGQAIVITTSPTAEASSCVFPINYPSFPSLVEPGQQLQVGRYLSTDTEGGSLFLQVKEISDTDVICEALTSATLDGLLTVMEFEIDFISLSYVNSAQDVYECRALLDSIHMLQTKIVAKMERKAAIHNFVAIAEAADGVILSRGNLGLDFDPEDMAILQKRCIAQCNQLGKPIILTRIVDTMVTAPRCTRAEATDVANAVLDGADGVMLGAETLRGLYPVQTVQTVVKLCAAAEQHFDYLEHHEALVADQFDNHHMPRGRSSSTFNGYDSPDHQYGLSPTAGMTHHHYFTPTADGNAHLANLTSAHSIYTASGSGTQQDLEAFGSLTLTAQGQAGAVPAAARAFGSLTITHTEAQAAAAAAAVHQEADGATYASAYSAVIASKYQSSFGNLPGLASLAGLKRSESAEALRRAEYNRTAVLRLESIASSAVRTAEKIAAGLIVVMTQSGRTASLVAKYRPPMPVLAVVVPTLRSDGLEWRLEGKYLARQCHIIRGVSPMLAAPMSEGSDDLLSEAIFLATSQKLAKPNDYVVVVCNEKGALVFKVVQVNETGTGMKTISGGNSLILGEDPDIISEENPFGGYRSLSMSTSTRRGSRGLSFKGAGMLGAALGSPMILTKADAEAVASEGSTHGGVLGGKALAEQDGVAAQELLSPRSSSQQRMQRLSSVLGRTLPGTLSP